MTDVTGHYIPPTEEDGNTDRGGQMKACVTISGIWLRRMGDKVQVLVEGEQGWAVAIEGFFDEPFDRVAVVGTAYRWTVDLHD